MVRSKKSLTGFVLSVKKVMSYRVCPICSSPWRSTQFAWLSQCSSCDFLVSDLSGSPESTTEVMCEASRAEALKYLRQENFKKILKGLKNILPSFTGKNLLDVGCAHGWFLTLAQKAGFHCIGIEPSSAPQLDPEISQMGIEVRCGYFPNACEKSEQFDVIVFNDVFEHLPDIRSAIEACRDHIKPKSFLILNVPSAKGLFYRLAVQLARFGVNGPLERLWQKDLPSPHLVYFTPTHLRDFVKAYGFSPLGEVPLETISLKGLWSRIRYVSQLSIVTSSFLYIVIAMIFPFINWAPRDTYCEIFQKKGDPL
jgi:SAM-dependent methyltransferase